jgi:thymidylate synthase
MTMPSSPPLYTPRYKPGQVLCGHGVTAIVTGWTLRQAIAKRLDPADYAAIGQLYSPTRGISVLVRNLLCNPHVRHLIAIAATSEDHNAGGCACVRDFFERGVTPGQTETGRDCWRINSEINGFLDSEIPLEAIEQLRANVQCHFVTSSRDACDLAKDLAKLATTEAIATPWGIPQEFPIETSTTHTRPGPRYGHRITGSTIADTWVKILHRIESTGTVRPTAYDGQWQELIDLVAVVSDEPRGLYFPEPNFLPVSREFLAEYSGQILADLPDAAKSQDGVKYTYGQRLRSWFNTDQIEQTIDRLTRDRHSARAVMSLWDAAADGAGTSSPPCLNHIWVRIADDVLSLTATFRSNDMFGAWVANAMGLRMLQEHIMDTIADRSGLSLQLGPLITISQSAHIYDDCWDNARRTIADHYPRVCGDRQFGDPSGSFLIAVRSGEIAIEQLTPGSGEVVECFSGKTAKRVYQQLAASSPALETEHALYLGTELQKAELALHYPDQFSYEQDKALHVISP